MDQYRREGNAIRYDVADTTRSAGRPVRRTESGLVAAFIAGAVFGTLLTAMVYNLI